MKIKALAIIFLGILLMAGCTPSVRYARDGHVDRPDNRSSGTGSGRQKAVYGGVEDSLQSGWVESDGGADRRQPDWLASALSSADQGQPKGGRREGAAKGEAKGAAFPVRTRSLEQVVSTYLGIPYKHGGTTRSGFDCSGFVAAVYHEVYGIPLKRSTVDMWKEGARVSLASARPGDLVFFKGRAVLGPIGHVGIYMGQTRFVHASSKLGVVYANLNDTYYAKRLVGFRRMD